MTNNVHLHIQNSPLSPHLIHCQRIHHTSWIPKGNRTCSMRYKSIIMVSVISIFEAFWVCCILDYFIFHDTFLDIMPFSSFHLGSWNCSLVSGLPWEWVFYKELPWRDIVPFPSILTTFNHLKPLISLSLAILGCIDLRRGCPSFHEKEGLKAQRDCCWLKR